MSIEDDSVHDLSMIPNWETPYAKCSSLTTLHSIFATSNNAIPLGRMHTMVCSSKID